MRPLFHIITKKHGQENNLKRMRYFYLSMTIIVLCTAIVIWTHLLNRQEWPSQQNIESRLPTGDYLPDAEHPLIRVLLKTDGFRQIAHQQVEVSGEKGLLFEMTDGTTYETSPGERMVILPDHELFQHGTIRIYPKEEKERISLHSLMRGYGTPSYRGCMELYPMAEGIVIVNELTVEEYLYAVVPSEMPASYHAEALKCQAICARSYAYCQMQVYGYPEYYAHVDDSVSYQVYGNSLEKEPTSQAVDDTRGKKIWYKGNVIKTYYYSTSSGHSTDVGAWGSKMTTENQYLKGVSICNKDGKAYEKDLPWYRWEAVIPHAVLSNLVELNSGKEIGELRDIRVSKRGTGDIALQITIIGTDKTIEINTENRIRSVLGGEGYHITKQDGTVIESTRLLPSAFFSIEKNGKNYIIKGGGYGHGIGMSQNGANEMAKEGKTCEEILQFFYADTQVK